MEKLIHQGICFHPGADEREWFATSASVPGAFYRVAVGAGCSCPAGRHRRACKHLMGLIEALDAKSKAEAPAEPTPVWVGDWICPQHGEMRVISEQGTDTRLYRCREGCEWLRSESTWRRVWPLTDAAAERLLEAVQGQAVAS